MPMIVTFALAKRLKKDGFKKPTYYYYSTEGNLGCSGALEDFNSKESVGNFTYYSAPTYLELADVLGILDSDEIKNNILNFYGYKGQ